MKARRYIHKSYEFLYYSFAWEKKIVLQTCHACKSTKKDIISLL